MNNSLSFSYSSMLYNLSDYEKQLIDITQVLTETLTKINKQEILSFNFLDIYKKYPKYPSDFKVINSLNKYNLVKIYNVAQNDVNQLINGIVNSNVLNLKVQMDTIPEKKIKDDFYLQTTFFSKILGDVVDINLTSAAVTEKVRKTYVYKTFGYAVPANIKDSSFIFLYAFYLLINKNLQASLRLFENTYQYIVPSLPGYNVDFVDSIEKYIDDNIDDLTDSLTRFILIYTYNLAEPSNVFINGLKAEVKPQLLKIKYLFSKFFRGKDIISISCASWVTKVLYSLISSDLTNNILDSSIEIINKDIFQIMKDYELKKIDDVFLKYSSQSFNEYLYLIYFYKNSPQKFLNVLQLVINGYTKQNLRDPNDTAFIYSEILSYLHRLFGTIGTQPTSGFNFKNIEEIFNSVITSDYIEELLINHRTIEYGFRTNMSSYFDEFFDIEKPENKDINEFIDDLFSIFFKHLKNSVQVDPYKEYFFNRKLFSWYISAFFQRDLFQNKIFYTQEYQLQESFLSILRSETFKTSFNIEKMRIRTIQFFEGNITSIENFFENILTTSVDKKLHSDNITYFLN